MTGSDPATPPLPDGAQLAELVGGRLEGENRVVRDLASPEAAGPESAVVVWDAAQLAALSERDPALVVLPRALGPTPLPYPVVRVEEARLALARLTARFDRRPRPDAGVHPGAHVHPTARLGKGVRVAAGAVVGAGATLGEGTIVGPGCVVGDGARLGAGCRLHANVTLYDGVTLGDRVEVHSGAVIGADGFGYAPTRAGAIKIRHLGTVVIGNDVEIGANTAIDRATLGATRIGDRTKIDNLCQVAHNVVIGSDCLLAGLCGIAGSAVLGDGVVLGGGTLVSDHVTIGDGARLAGRSGVTKDVPPGETWAGFPAQPYRQFARRNYLLSRLERIWQHVLDSESRASG